MCHILCRPKFSVLKLPSVAAGLYRRTMVISRTAALSSKVTDPVTFLLIEGIPVALQPCQLLVLSVFEDVALLISVQ